MQMLSYEGYRRQVLKELTDVKVYVNFHVTVRAYATRKGLERLAHDIHPVLKECYDTNKSIEDTARRLDDLMKLIMHQANLYALDVENDMKESR